MIVVGRFHLSCASVRSIEWVGNASFPDPGSGLTGQFWGFNIVLKDGAVMPVVSETEAEARERWQAAIDEMAAKGY